MIKKRNISRRQLLLLAILAVLATALAGAHHGRFDYSELCAVCGRGRDVVDWQIPGTQRTYYSTLEERATSLSGVLENRQLVEAHAHQWHFVRGHGNGSSLVFGAGHPLSWSLQGPQMGAFMEQMLQLTDRDTALQWLNHLRNPLYSRLCQSMANACSDETFANRDEWESWLADYETEHSQMIPHDRPQ